MRLSSMALTTLGIAFLVTPCGARAQLADAPAANAEQSGVTNSIQAISDRSLQSDARGDSAPALTLAQAEDYALKHQPRLIAQRLREQAAGKVVAEDRSAYFPQLAGNLTGVQANGDTAVAAGALTTSSISTRAAGGGSLLQLVTDFGRTNALVHSAKFSAQASGEKTESIRQQILREVDESYFGLQAAESVRKTAHAVLDFRKLSLRQLNALAQSQLKSSLDVQFAQVLVSEAEMAVVRANSSVDEAKAQLAAAMGDESMQEYVLGDEPLPAPLESDVSIYVEEAIQNRPDLSALKLQLQAAQQFALSEKKLGYPTINVLGNAGEIPAHDSTLHQDYGAVGLNVNIPIFNGGLYSNREAEAKLRAQAAGQDVADLAITVARDVRTVYAKATDAALEMQVAQRLVDQTNVAMHLAQARYDAGLGSIVELNEAELNQTSALITAASARFDYLGTRTELDYTLGIKH
jgi:outer membrane protein